MRLNLPRLLLWAMLVTPLITRAAGAADAPPPDRASFFRQKVQPMLANTCLKCHGGRKVRGGLRLDTRAGLLKGGDRGPAVVPGEPTKSLLIQALRHTHDELKMPPDRRLPDPVIADFAAWIKVGAAWPSDLVLAPPQAARLWAFEPVRHVEPPSDPSGWSTSPIDGFIRTRLRKRGLEPAGAADKRTLIRRVTFDLTGLPPAPAEVDAFLADRSDDAYERLVDRLLASPRYGERWGRHWLDVARYADTGGFETDHLYPSAWRYRDYVIHAFNADKPFDRFVQEQVAGDELWPDDSDAVRATDLYCVAPALPEAAMMPNQLEYEWLTDAADTTGAAFLGLTVGCARCHDHKFDPISQKDYYGLQAVFAASDRPYPVPIRLQRIKVLNGLLADVPVPKQFLNDPRCTVLTEDRVGFHLFHRREPMAVHRLQRGELSKPGEIVAPAVPAVLRIAQREPDLAAVAPTRRRAAFARWLTSPDNPLTARVLVNRVWAWHFGQGLVRTPNDFGSQGEPPSHPELLDWLARDFMDHGWSLKHLHRRILLSGTYRMLRAAGGRGLQVDPDDRLLWHFPRRRLEGEAIRDTMLACAGTLNGKLFGPPVMPPLGGQELAGLFDARAKWPVTKDTAQHTRRSVYVLVRRTFVYPMFSAFDPPEVMTSCPRRFQTIVPTQALTLLNSPLVRQQAEAFARRLLRECGDRPERLIARAWQFAFGRPATPADAGHAVAFLRKRAAALAAPGGAESPREAALAELCLALFNANEFIYVD